MVNELHVAQLNKTNNQKTTKKTKNKTTKNNFLLELQKQYLTLLNFFFFFLNKQAKQDWTCKIMLNSKCNFSE